MYILTIERKLARQTPVYDHADRLLFSADRDKARELMQRRDVDIIGTTTRIKALRFRGPDPALNLRSGSRRRRQIGAPHKHENYYNVAGVWHIDRIPDTYRPEFCGVLLDCLREAA
jgi:hypothetical protein